MIDSRSALGAALNLKVQLIAEGRRNRPGSRISPTHITIHNTSNTNRGADADAHSRFVRNTGHYTLRSGRKNWVSWHYTVDDGEVIKQLPVHEKAFHAGRGNNRSIGIENCMHSDNDQDASDERLAKLVAVLRHDLGIGRAGVVPHKHWTGKNCPILMLPKFDAFLDRVDEILLGIQAESPSGALMLDEEERLGIEGLETLGLELTPEEAARADAEEEIDHDLLAEALQAEAPQ